MGRIKEMGRRPRSERTERVLKENHRAMYRRDKIGRYPLWCPHCSFHTVYANKLKVHYRLEHMRGERN